MWTAESIGADRRRDSDGGVASAATSYPWVAPCEAPKSGAAPHPMDVSSRARRASLCSAVSPNFLRSYSVKPACTQRCRSSNKPTASSARANHVLQRSSCAGVISTAYVASRMRLARASSPGWGAVCGPANTVSTAKSSSSTHILNRPYLPRARLLGALSRNAGEWQPAAASDRKRWHPRALLPVSTQAAWGFLSRLRGWVLRSPIVPSRFLMSCSTPRSVAICLPTACAAFLVPVVLEAFWPR